MSTEKRRTDRLMTNYTLKISRHSSPSSRFVQANLVNISKVGCKLKMKDIQTGFAVGEGITIRFHLPDLKISGGEILKLEAEVAWAYPDGSELGCKFKEIDAKTEKIFAQMIAHLGIS